MSKFDWYRTGDGRLVYRAAPKPIPERSGLPCPHIISDKIDPVVSMADGNLYDSASALRRTYKASGNPQGIDYIEIGNESLTKPFKRPKSEDAKILETIDKAQAALREGHIPEIGKADADVVASAKMIQV